MPSIKEIYNSIGEVELNANSINLNVDGLEALASTQQADVAAIKADLADGIPVSAASLPLPAGAATSANQTTANTTLSNIDTDLGALADSAASTDTGSFSLISLFKRLLSTKLPDQSSGRIPVTLASAGTTGSTTPTTANLYAGTDGTNLRAISVDSSGRANTNIIPQSGNITTRSSTITTGGTSQQVAASNTSRKYFAIQNISDTDMYLGVGYTPTTTTGILLSKSGGGFVFESNFIPTQAINILCATTGKAFVAWEG